jgi:hypothetical protein
MCRGVGPQLAPEPIPRIRQVRRRAAIGGPRVNGGCVRSPRVLTPRDGFGTVADRKVLVGHEWTFHRRSGPGIAPNVRRGEPCASTRCRCRTQGVLVHGPLGPAEGRSVRRAMARRLFSRQESDECVVDQGEEQSTADGRPTVEAYARYRCGFDSRTSPFRLGRPRRKIPAP